MHRLALTIAGLGSAASAGTPSSLLLSWMPSAISLGLTAAGAAAAAVAAPTPGPAPPPPAPPPPVVPRQIYQFTDGNDIENVLVRRDGTLLLTTLNSGDLLALDPASPHPAPQAVAHLNGSTGLSGLAPLSAPDGDGDDYMLYAVSGGVHTPFHLEDVAVYVVALPNAVKGKQPISLSAGVVRDRISVNGTLNGMAALPDCPETVLCADSLGHRVFRVNTRTRAVDIAIDDFMLGPGSNTAFPIGINGLRIYKGYMYYTNSGQGFFARVKIDSYGNQAGPFEVLARIPQRGPASPSNAYDDFTSDAHGNAYLSYHSFAFTKVTPSGQQTTFVGGGSNYTTVIEPSSAATSPDGKTIYLVTAGATVNGVVEGGQVLEAMIP